MRSTRRILVIVVALGTALTAAVPAAAKKPPKPPVPAPAGVAVSITAEPVWVHEATDQLHYTLTVDNTGDTARQVEVVFTAGFEEDLGSVQVPANGSMVLTTSRHVADFPESTVCVDYEECTLRAAVEVFEGGTPAAEASVGSILEFYPECDFGSPVTDLCIWKPAAPGIYEVTLAPTSTGNPNATSIVLFTVRDHIPGNWCTTPPDSGLEPSGALRIRWRESDGPVALYVYFPPDGVCLSGGAAGDYFPIGNPESLYLVADGTVTVQPWTP